MSARPLNKSKGNTKKHPSTSSKICLTVYELLYILLREEDSGIIKLCLMRIVDFFQLMVFPFNGDAQFPWNAGSVYTSLESVLEVFQIINYLSNFPWYTYLVAFYLGILLVLLVILDIVYVLYSIARKKFSVVWPLKALTSFCSLFVTVLFLPLLKLFVSMVSCKKASNGVDFVHSYYPDVTCWRGMHIMHAVLAMVFSLIFVCISLVVTLTFYEARTFTSNAGARRNSRADFFLIVYKIACIFLFAFFYDKTYSWLLVTLLLAGSAYNYYSSKTERPYYNGILALLCNISNAIYLYINVVLFLCMLLRDTSFSGGFQLTVLGLGVVVLAEFFSADPTHAWMTKQFTRLTTAGECAMYLRYFTHIVHSRHVVQSHEVALEGYVSRHLETCKSENCQLKMYRGLRGLKKDKAAQTSLSKMLLATHIKKRFKEATQRFPNSAELCIQYAFFYLEVMRSPTDATRQLRKAQRREPALDEDFVIFRYIRMIEEDKSGYKHQGDAVGMDRVSLITYDNYYRQCKRKMKEVATLQAEFWSELSLQNPDVVLLIMHSGKIADLTSEVVEYWRLMQELNANMPKAVVKYSTFLRDVLNDSESAHLLLRTIKEDIYKFREKDLNTKRRQDQNRTEEVLESCRKDGTPWIRVSGELESLGIIKSVSRAFCRIVGCEASDLVGFLINKLMPGIVADKHSQILKDAYRSPEESMLAQKEQPTPLQLTNGYFLMVFMHIRVMPTFENDMSYIITFRMDRAAEFNELCYLLADVSLSVVGMSEKAITMLKMSNATLERGRPSLKALFPEITAFVLEDAQTEGFQVSYVLPDRTYGDIIGSHEGILSKNLLNNPYLPTHTGKISLDCRISKMPLNLGYIVKLSNTYSRADSFNYCRTLIAVGTAQCQFDFRRETQRYYRHKASIKHFADSCRDLAKVPASSSEDESGTDANEEAIDEVTGFKDMCVISPRDSAKYLELRTKAEVTVGQIQNHLANRVHKYSSGVKTYRLIGDKRVRVRKDKDRHPLMPEEEERKVPIVETELERAKLVAARKLFAQLLSCQPVSAPIRNLCLVSGFLLVSFIVVTAVLYSYAEESLYTLRDVVHIAWQRSEIYYYSCDMMYLATSLALLQDGTITNYENATTAAAFEEMLRAQIKNEVRLVLDEAKQGSELAIIFPSITEEFLITKNFAIRSFSETGTETVKMCTYIDTIYMITSAMITLSNTPLDKITLANTDLKFVRYNLLNGIGSTLENVEYGFLSTLLNFVNKIKDTFRYIMYGALCAYFLVSHLIYPFMVRAHSAQEEVLKLFLRMPRTEAIKLQSRCESFCSKTGRAHTASAAAFIDLGQNLDNEDEEGQLLSGSGDSGSAQYAADAPTNGAMHKREFLKATNSWWSSLWKALLAMMVLGGYFVFDFFFFAYVGDVMLKNVNIIYYVSSLNLIPMFAFNLMREAVMNTGMPILNMNYGRVMASVMVAVVVNITEGCVTKNEETDYLYMAKHVDTFNTWMFGTMCDNWGRFGYFKSQKECESFDEGLPTQGYFNLIVDYILVSQGVLASSIVSPALVFNSARWVLLRTMLKYVFHPMNEEYMFYVLGTIVDITFSAQLVMLGVALVYIFVGTFYFLVIWIPYIVRLQREIRKTNAMLLIIPPEVYISNRFLREAFENKVALFSQSNYQSGFRGSME